MRRGSGFGAVVLLGMLVAMGISSPMSAGDDQEQWTLAVYMDADNSLEWAGILNLDWLETVGSDENVNIVVLMDTYVGEADLLYVNEGSSTSVGQSYGYPKEVNMADQAVLEEFIEVVCDDYAADKYCLILWDHGGGWRGICWDDTTYEETGVDDCITMTELGDALAGAYEDTGVVFDVLAFDACLMAMPEVAYEAIGFADYCVFSEETIYGQGFPYDAIARDLVAAPEMDGEEYSVVLAEDFAEFYNSLSGYIDWTISAFDMAYMKDLVDAVDYLGTELLLSLNTYVNAYQNDMIKAQEYYYPYNIDLKMFASNLLSDPSIKDQGIRNAALAVSKAVSDGMVISIASWINVYSTGMAIYMPSTVGGMHAIKDDYDEVRFAVETSWYDFVYAFSTFDGRNWAAEKLPA